MKELCQSDFTMKLVKDLGMQYSNPENPKGRRYRFGIFECKCGRQQRMQVGNAKRYLSCQSCANTKHGKSNDKLYTVYNNIRLRTMNETYRDYPSYGGRGIKMCSEWENSFEAFYSWAVESGYKLIPNNNRNRVSIDRIDNNKGYSPENCRWVTQSIQCENQGKTKRTTTSIYRGVNIVGDKWLSRITHKGKRTRLGLFDTEHEAAKAYNDFAIKNKTNHHLNVIKDSNEQ